MAIKYSELTRGQIEALVNKLGGMEGVKQFLADEIVLVERSSVSKPALLVKIDDVQVGAVARFVAAEKFVKENTPDDVQLYGMNDDFKKNFLGIVEEHVPACTLQKHRLIKSSLDKPILDELGDCAKTKLSHLWELLKKQPEGERGALLTDGRANIWYIEDVKGDGWAVDARWLAGRGWCVGAYSMSLPNVWGAGYAVFSR